jgi:hypothetical protein
MAGGGRLKAQPKQKTASALMENRLHSCVLSGCGDEEVLINRLHQGYGRLSSSSEVLGTTISAVGSPSLFKHKEIIESKLKSLLRSHLERRKQQRRFPDVIPVVLFER